MVHGSVIPVMSSPMYHSMAAPPADQSQIDRKSYGERNNQSKHLTDSTACQTMHRGG
jgi:hypothetical protein